MALGICVEEGKLLLVDSLHQCESFVSRVQLLQPCLDRALGQNYAELCSAAHLQHLGSIRSVCRCRTSSGVRPSVCPHLCCLPPPRSLWHWMLIVASFIQHVIFKIEEEDSRLMEVAIKHCNLHLNVCRNSAARADMTYRLPVLH